MRIYLLLFLVAVGCTNIPEVSTRLEKIEVAADGKTFQTVGTKRRFVPWGMNYGNGGRLMEDFWEGEWETFAGDFRELKAMGANVVRVHLQYGKFMRSAREADAGALRKLRGMVALAERVGIYLDVTGLACYRPGDTPAWYDAMEEKERWAAQARFWEVVAEACAGSPAVFCFDLINEPISPGDRKPQWRSGSLFGGFDFLQFIARDPAGRTREEIAVAWIRAMTAAIRKHDDKTLITVGLLPWSQGWKHLSGFLPEKVGPELDFISVHIYPESKKPGEAMEGLEKFAVGKPVVIEETFPLSCTVAELEEFMVASKKYATGWIGHYDGETIEELNALKASGKISIAQSIYLSWLELFVRRQDFFAGD